MPFSNGSYHSIPCGSQLFQHFNQSPDPKLGSNNSEETLTSTQEMKCCIWREKLRRCHLTLCHATVFISLHQLQTHRKSRVSQHQGLEFLGNYYSKRPRAVCFKDGLERAGVKGAPGVLPSGFAAQFAVMLSNMNLLQHNKLN